MENTSRIKKMLDSVNVSWVEEFPSVLWSYRTTSWKATGEFPFILCFDLEALIPAKVGNQSARNLNFCLENNDQCLLENLLLIDSIWEEVARRDDHFKMVVPWYHKSQVWPSSIQVGDFVLRKNEASKQETSRKLGAI